jgi:hypothetical protein
MVKKIVVLTVFVSSLILPRSVPAQHDHGGGQPDAGTVSQASGPGSEQIDQIHKLVARIAVVNGKLQASEDPATLRAEIEEQGRIIAQLRSLVTEHHALMAEQQGNPKPAKSKKRGCGHRSRGMEH